MTVSATIKKIAGLICLSIVSVLNGPLLMDIASRIVSLVTAFD